MEILLLLAILACSDTAKSGGKLLLDQRVEGSSSTNSFFLTSIRFPTLRWLAMAEDQGKEVLGPFCPADRLPTDAHRNTTPLWTCRS